MPERPLALAIFIYSCPITSTIADLADRMTTALTASPSAMAGRIIHLRFPRIPSVSGTKPPDGNHFSLRENNKINMVPSQKLGMEIPRRPVTVAAESGALLRLQAAQYPIGIPKQTARSR